MYLWYKVIYVLLYLYSEQCVRIVVRKKYAERQEFDFAMYISEYVYL